MAIFVRQIALSPDAPASEAIERAERLLSVSAMEVKSAEIAKVSVDARHREIRLIYSVKLELLEKGIEPLTAGKVPFATYIDESEPLPERGSTPLRSRPVIAGFGPAGIFAALTLAREGFRPIVLERGGDMDSRVTANERFKSGGALDDENNIQFGEGGAGAFSDGKLLTRINDPLCREVLGAFIDAGAPKEIAWLAKPHIGTDLLRGVIKTLRAKITELGGEVRFNTKLTDIIVKNGRVSSVISTGGEIETELLIIALGHSARDSFTMLRDRGFSLCAKPFSAGIRIEHLQKDIDRALYRSLAGHPALPRGEYALNHHTAGGRGVYTFCMCPGGEVVAAASEQGGIVTNGMSLHARDGENANSAIAVSLSEKDFGGDPFRAVEWQRSLECAAFRLTGSYRAPAQDVESFLEAKSGLNLGRITPSYPLGVQAADIGALLGNKLAGPLREGIRAFGAALSGFDCADAVITAPETRTSSPLRVRREDMEALGVGGVFPVGEGAGYAGGIMSAAVDGIKAARKIISSYRSV